MRSIVKVFFFSWSTPDSPAPKTSCHGSERERDKAVAGMIAIRLLATMGDEWSVQARAQYACGQVAESKGHEHDHWNLVKIVYKTGKSLGRWAGIECDWGFNVMDVEL